MTYIVGLVSEIIAAGVHLFTFDKDTYEFYINISFFCYFIFLLVGGEN